MKKKLNKKMLSILLMSAMLLTACGGKTDVSPSQTADAENIGSSQTSDVGSDDSSQTADAGNIDPLQTADAEGRFAEPVTVTCMVWSYADRSASTDKWIEDCKEKFNIDIELQNIPTENYAATLKTKVAADDMPDIVSVHEITKSYSTETMTIDENTFIDLSDLENVKNYNEEAVDNVRINGSLYYVPVSQNALGVLYNKQVFQANGIEIPQSYAALITAMDTLKSNGIVPLAGSFSEAWSSQIIPFLAFDNYVLGDNPEIAKDLYDSATDISKRRWSDLGENSEKALGLIKEWIDAGYFTDDPLGTDASVASQLLATGKAAMFVTGNWQYSVAAGASEDPDNIGFFPLPLNEAGGKIYVSTSANEGMCINSKSENLEAAKVALNYYLSTEMQEAVMKDFGGVSTNREVTSDDAFVQELSNAINDNISVPGGFFGGRDYLFPMDCSFNKEIECQSLAAGLITPKEFCEKMDKAIAETAIIE